MKAPESVIRLMTRLAVQHGAVNLAQGYPDEPPPAPLVQAAISAMLGGTDEGADRLSRLPLGQLAADALSNGAAFHTLADLVAGLQGPRDLFNQYSFPFGLTELRSAIADYTERFYGFRPDPEVEVTVSLGATEGLASTLAGVCEPGDGVVVMQPFHELYPAQARVFGLEPRFVTLREREERGDWQLDLDEVEQAARDGARVLILNTPHNPTGKVFSDAELDALAGICRTHNLLAVTDEIYEHIVYEGRHCCLATLPGMRERTIVVSSISKTANATGWRVGWVIAPPALMPRIRGVHDTLVIQAPTPFQKAAVELLKQPPAFYERLRNTYLEKRAVLTDALLEAGFRVTQPQGAYYLFARYRGVRGLERLAPGPAAMTLIERYGVAPVPGDNFYATGADGDSYLRFAFCRSLTTLREAGDRLRRLHG